jgi:hypothetical protein
LVRTGFLALALLALVPAMAVAQSSIAGVVKDTTGAVMPGVTVEAASPALIEKVRNVVTDGQGLYRIVDLRPGTYSVTFSLTGFNTVKRDGLDLPSDFTATVNAELRVGTLEETITVSAEAPVVDVQSTVKNRVFANEVVEDLPTNRVVQTLAQYIPGVIGGLNIDGPNSRALTIHGSRVADTNSAIDGMSDRRASTGGQAVTFYGNEGSIQEVSIVTDSGNAEQQFAGVWMNTIPKEGGNIFHYSIVGNYSNQNLSADNLTPALLGQGLTAVNGLKRSWDFNPNGGGRLVRDKLWFYGAYRNTEVDKYVANSYYEKDPLAWAVNPDLSRQAVNEQLHSNYALRLTWQATPKNKINIGYEMDKRLTPHRRAAATQPPEATTYTPFHPTAIGTIVWKSPVSNKFLLEGAAMVYAQDWDERVQIEPLVPWGTISATESSTNTIFRSSAVYGHNVDHPITFRGAASYVTGSHAFKVGFTDRWRGDSADYNNLLVLGDMTYTLRNGSPTSVTLYATPIEYRNNVRADLGIFAQDSWTLKQLTVNYGVRYDSLKANVPAQHLPAGRFVPARDYAPVSCTPCWNDISPRVGASYDLLGDGKTALKASVGRYVTGGTLSQANNPVNTSVNSANRNWQDSNGNFIPDCDFSNPSLNGECGALLNLNFGNPNPNATRFDPEVLKGWGKRPYSWEASAGLQRELRPGLSVEAGYYRRWFGNFTVTDNLDVTSADYSQYCITAPANDPRLPTAGQQLCGFYDLNPTRADGTNLVGLVHNLVTFTSKFGKQTEIYNGVDLLATLRANGVTLSGGMNVGNVDFNNCFVVDSPMQIADPTLVLNPTTNPRSAPADWCHLNTTWQPQYKFYGVYPLPWWGIQTSATLQLVPGPSAGGLPGSVTASYVTTNGEIRPSLGRNLSSGANGTATVELIKPFTIFGEYAKQLDTRFSKSFKVGPYRLRASVDVYNLLNRSNVQTLNTRLSSNNANNQWLLPTQILQARYFQFGTQIDF